MRIKIAPLVIAFLQNSATLSAIAPFLSHVMKLHNLTATFLCGMLTFVAGASAENLEHLTKLFNTKECQKCDLRGSGLVFANLSNMDLSGADLRNANLSRADLSGIILKNANLRGASLLGANLKGADLSGADLSDADLNSTDLSGADLKGANLKNTDMRRAYLVNADLKGATLENTYLRGAVGIPSYAIKPDDFYVWGVEEAQKGNYKAAIEQFNQSLTIDPKFAFSYLGRAMSRQRIGDRAGAIQDSQIAEQLFTEAKNPEGAKVSQELVKALQNPPDQGGSNTFGAIVNTVGSVLMQLFLR